MQRARAFLQSSSDGVPLERSTLCEAAEVMALAPIHGIRKKEIAAVRWCIELSAVMSHGSTNPAWKQTSASLWSLGQLSIPLFSLEHTPGIL